MNQRRPRRRADVGRERGSPTEEVGDDERGSKFADLRLERAHSIDEAWLTFGFGARLRDRLGRGDECCPDLVDRALPARGRLHSYLMVSGPQLGRERKDRKRVTRDPAAPSSTAVVQPSR